LPPSRLDAPKVVDINAFEMSDTSEEVLNGANRGKGLHPSVFR
jgi:hypothetical protein